MDIEILRTELTTDPLTRGYSGMTDQQATDSLNLVNRPDTVTIEDILRFLLLDNVHSTDGTDTQDRSLWQRMKEVVALAVTPTAAVANPWGSTAFGTVTEIQQVKTHTLFDFFTLSAQGGLVVDLTDSNFQIFLAGAQAAGCMSTTQETALLALADNQQARGQEIGFGEVKLGNVVEARS